MNTFDLVLKDGIALLSDKNSNQFAEESVDIGIKDGHIAFIGSIHSSKAKHVFSAKNLHILPGLIDSQVHFREPGMEHKENFETGSRSALLGGITAVFEMPNTKPPTTDEQALEDKLTRADSRFYCDYAFFAGASPDNKNQLHQLELHRGCCGVKVFMGSSTGNLLLDDVEDLEVIVKNGRRRMAIHAEDEKLLSERKKWIQEGHPASHAIWRNKDTALIATQKVVALAQKYQRNIHVLHITTKEEIEFLSKNKNVASVEVTPQHLSLYAPDCYDQLGTFAQMNPPIRSKEHHEALWKGVLNGTVDIIGSDHAPHTIEEKNQNYPASPSGMPGVQTLLPLLLNHRHQQRIDLQSIVRLLAVNPCRLFKIKKRGHIRQQFLANFTLVDLKKTQTITKDWLAYRCGWSPFENQKVTGWPVATILHGELVMQEGEILTTPKGKMIEFDSI